MHNAERLTLGIPPEIQTVSIRRCQSASAEPELVAHGDGTPSSGMAPARRLLDRAEPPTAIFCYNDRLAMAPCAPIREVIRESTARPAGAAQSARPA